MKYLKVFNTHDDYAAYIVGASFKNLKNDNVSYCKLQKDVHYNPYIPPIPANLLDILYSDVNGNLSYTSEVLPVSEGKTPIGLCIAGTGFFGENEPARWMSLKYMNCTTPETGSLTSQDIYWGNSNTDINTIDNIQITHNGGSSRGYLIDYYNNNGTTPPELPIPTLFTENNEWNISVLGTINTYVVTDIDGKNKTDKILATATAQTTWQTDTSITNESGVNYAPAACCCVRYHTIGTQSGDWYLGAGGEMSIIPAKKLDINTKLTAINEIYPNDCISWLDNDSYWTSTEFSSNITYTVSTYNAYINYAYKYDKHVIALLQY